MHKNQPQETGSEISGRLKNEANQRRPDFSRVLHDRIMRTVASCERPERPVRRKSPPLLALAGTALIVASVAWLWQPGTPPSASPMAEKPGSQQAKPVVILNQARADDFLAAATLIINPLQQDEQFEAVLVAELVALLDHDARLATDWVLDPLKLAMAN